MDTIQCPLCGFRFALSELDCHAHCPLARGCRVVCCPHCHYGFLGPRAAPPAPRGKGVRRWPWTRAAARR